MKDKFWMYLAIVCFCLGLYFYANGRDAATMEGGTGQRPEAPFTTISELQVHLKEDGLYDDDIDSIVGPNTIKGMELHGVQIEYERSMKGMGL